MIIDDMTGRCGEWLKGCGPESDIVMSSRVRLARNLADYPFIRKCTDIDRANIESTVRERLSKESRLDNLTFINVADLENLDRQFLVERQLISREHANSDGARAVAIDAQIGVNATRTGGNSGTANSSGHCARAPYPRAASCRMPVPARTSRRKTSSRVSLARAARALRASVLSIYRVLSI